MKTKRLNALLETIGRNPWSSAQDMLLLTGVMVGAVLLALSTIFLLLRTGSQRRNAIDP